MPQSLASKINHGTKIANRIVMIWRASMYLDKEYLDVLKTKDPYILLESAIHEDCIDKLVVLSDIMTSMELTNKEVDPISNSQRKTFKIIVLDC